MTGKYLRVGAVIVSWNSMPFLERCIESLLDQTYKFSDIVIVDNASDGDDVRRLAKKYAQVTFLFMDKNLGFAAGSNVGIRHLRSCDWIALINPDAFPEKAWLCHMTDSIGRNPAYACFGSRLIMNSAQYLLDGIGDVYHTSGLAWREGHAQVTHDEHLLQREIFSPCAAAAIYRADVLFSVGLFDEDYFCYFEDVDLGFRLRLIGHRCLYVPDAIVRHVGSATTGGRGSIFSIYHGHRNLVWTYIKNMPGLLFWLYLPQHIALNIVTLIYYLSKGYGKVIFIAKWDALKGIRRMWLKRRGIQGRRTISAVELRGMLRKGFAGLLSHHI